MRGLQGLNRCSRYILHPDLCRSKTGRLAGLSEASQSRSNNLFEKDRPHIRNGIAAGPGAADAAIVNDMMMNHARFLDLDPHRDFYLPDLVRALVRVQDQRSDLLPIFVS